nr:MAG TPA: hypothetical protein [Caudoviricetes sp.]
MQGSSIFVFTRQRQKLLPNRLSCNHASAYIVPFSWYFVM